MKRLLPAPVLSVVLALLWLVLWDTRDITVGAGAVLVGLVVPLLTARLRPNRPRIRRPGLVLLLMVRIAWDCLRSSLDVAWLLLTRRARDIPSGFLEVPLLIQDPHAVATLAVLVTAVPGTALAELAADRRALLVHVFASVDDDVLLEHIRRHYQLPLKEIYES